MARGGSRPSSGSRRVTPRAESATPARRIRKRDLVVVTLLLVGLLAGLVLVVFSGPNPAPTTTTTAPQEGAAGTLPLDDLSKEAIESWSGLQVPEGAEDFLTARVGDAQLDVTFTMARGDEQGFVAASELPEPEAGARQILHSSPLWKLNPGVDDSTTSTPASGDEGTTVPAEPGPDPEIRGTSDRRAGIHRAVELVDEGDAVRARVVLTAA